MTTISNLLEDLTMDAYCLVMLSTFLQQKRTRSYTIVEEMHVFC